LTNKAKFKNSVAQGLNEKALGIREFGGLLSLLRQKITRAATLAKLSGASSLNLEASAAAP
jgi:hypothetical protein